MVILSSSERTNIPTWGSSMFHRLMGQLPSKEDNSGLKVILQIRLALYNRAEMGETCHIPTIHKLVDLPGLRHLVIAHVNKAFPHPVNVDLKGKVPCPVVKPEIIQLVVGLLKDESPSVITIDLSVQPEVGSSTILLAVKILDGIVCTGSKTLPLKQHVELPVISRVELGLLVSRSPLNVDVASLE